MGTRLRQAFGPGGIVAPTIDVRSNHWWDIGYGDNHARRELQVDQQQVVRRRRLTAVVIICALAMGSLAAMVVAARSAESASQARSEMRTILNAVSAESAAVTTSYLSAAESAAFIVAAVHDEIGDKNALQQELFASIISANDQIDAVFVGYPNGDFSFVARSLDSNSAFRTREITTEPERVVENTWTDIDLVVLDRQFDPDNDYEPPKRGWFASINDGAETSWTDPYPFASSGQLGVTFSHAVRADDGSLTAVVGIDIRLSELVTFLKDRQPSENSQAAVVNADGLILAGSSTDVAAMHAAGDDAVLPRAEGASELIVRLNRSELLGQESPQSAGQFTEGDRTGNLRAVGGTGTWFLLVDAPETDFIGPLSGANSARIAVISLAAAILSALCLMAGFSRLRYLRSLRRAATTDELTGVASRAHATQLLENMCDAHFLRTDSQVMVAIVDLDHFKAVNDTLGHSMGDRVLATASRQLATAARSQGFEVGRLGGDEFVVFGAAGAGEHRRSLWNELNRQITTLHEREGLSALETLPMALSASVGIAIACGDSTPVADLLRMADQAMYDVKSRGGNGHAYANPEILGHDAVITVMA